MRGGILNEHITVTVIITTFNRQINFLKSAVKSVIEQTLKPDEIIVVDDNTNSLLSESIKSFCHKENIIYIHNLGTHGACAARNLGISRASGQFVAFLDDDDEWKANKLEEQVNAITNESVLIYCNGWKVDKRTNPETISEYRSSEQFINRVTFEELLEKNHIGTTSQLLIKKSALVEIDGFDEELPARQDYDLCLRLASCGNFIGINHHLFVHYIHFENQISKSSIASLRAYKKLYFKYKKYYDSQRCAKSNLFFKIARMERLQLHYIMASIYYLKGVICNPSNWKSGIKEIQKDATV